MAQSEIKAVEMVRRIRDRHHELLKDKTPEERTAFYEAKAKAAMERARLLLQGQAEDRGR
jgi:hypothetical protein